MKKYDNYDYDYDYDYKAKEEMQKPKKQGKKNSKQKLFFVFITTFFVVLVSFLGFARLITPTVNVPEVTSDENTDDSSDFRKRIDARLLGIIEEEKGPKYAQQATKEQYQEDKDKQNSEEMNSSNPKFSHKNGFDDEFFKDDEETTHPQQRKPAPPLPPRHSSGMAENPNSDANYAEVIPPMYKVMIGSYATVEDARAKSKELMASGMQITPFIRLVNGKYCIQVGSYTDVDKARYTANQLNSRFGSVQIIKEF